MEELLQASFAGANLFASGLLIFVLLYWASVLLGVLDLSSFDLDLSSDTHVDGAGDADWLNAALAFLNLGKVPLMFFVTFFALPFWVLSVGLNDLLGSASNLVGYLLIIPLALMSLIISKFMTWPFVKLFAAMEKEGETTQTLIGQTCTVLLTANNTQIGQAAVKTKGSPVLLNVRTAQEAEVLKGQTAVVIDYLPETNLYLIEPYHSL